MLLLILTLTRRIRVDAQWIVARKDYQKAKKRRKEWEKAERERRETTEEEDAVYRPEMYEMRCILYFHGGEYILVTPVNTFRCAYTNLRV